MKCLKMVNTHLLVVAHDAPEGEGSMVPAAAVIVWTNARQQALADQEPAGMSLNCS